MDNKEFSTTFEGFKQVVRNNIYNLIVLAVAVGYIFYGLLRVDETGKTIVQIITDGCLAFFVGYSIGKLMSMQGYSNGSNIPELLDAKKNHSEMVVEVNPNLDRLDEFCKVVNDKDIKDYQICILAGEALKYDDFIEGKYSDYKLKDNKKYSPSQKRAISRAYKPKFRLLTTNDLLRGESIKSRDKNDMGETMKENMFKTDRKALGNKIIYAIIFGYFSINVGENFCWESLIWTAIQVCCFLASGAMRYFNAYMFMKENLVDRYLKQIDYINMFKVWSIQNPRPNNTEVKNDNKID